MIAIVDYGMGNLRSVQKAFEFLGYDAAVTDQATSLADASHIVLPGVGAFRDAIRALESKGLDSVIKKEVGKGKPFLGICLGMQMLFDRSLEDGEYAGLGLVGGEVVRFETVLKIPHIGWNTLFYNKKTALFDGIKDNNFYFVHSYFVAPEDDALAAGTSSYGLPFVCAVARDNIFATQFHPEKSAASGLKIFSNFVHWNI